MYKTVNNTFSFPESIIDLRTSTQCLPIIFLQIQYKIIFPMFMEWPSHDYYVFVLFYYF